MDCSSVGEHVVVALLLVGARRHVAKVMDDARLVQNYVLEKEKKKREEKQKEKEKKKKKRKRKRKENMKKIKK